MQVELEISVEQAFWNFKISYGIFGSFKNCFHQNFQLYSSDFVVLYSRNLLWKEIFANQAILLSEKYLQSLILIYLAIFAIFNLQQATQYTIRIILIYIVIS